MAVEVYNLSVGGDFSPLRKGAEAQLGQLQNLFNRRLNTSALTRPLGQISSSTDEFSKSMAAANARVIAFGASAGLIFQVSQGIKNLVSSTIEVNKVFTELNVIFRKNTEDLELFKNQIFSIAKDTGQSFGNIAAGATELARQGLGAEETLKRLKDAAILSRQAGISLEESVESLTASINSFSRAGLTSTEVINKFANVDAAFAVSSKDLAEALKRVGSTASEARVSIDELIGLVTSAQQTTARGGAVIGNALKTIFTRIGRPEVINQLEQLGTVVRDFQGQLLPTSNILKNFAGSFDKASDSQKSYLAELVGSVYQINILKALLGDLSKSYSVVDQATQKSSKAQSQAIERNDEYNKSLSAALNRSKETFREVAAQIGNFTIAPVIDRGTKLVDLLFGNSEEDAKSVGAKIAEGAAKGLGEFLSGPGLLLVGAAVSKLAFSFAEFTGEALKSFAGLNKFALQQKQIADSLKETINFEPGLRDKILSKAISQVEVEKILLSLTQQRLEAVSRLEAVTSTASAQFLKSSQLGFDKSGKIVLPNRPGKTAAGGLIPDESIEKIGAVMGGYEPGSIKRMSVPGLGNVIYNSNEQVKDFGLGQPAIMPPKTSNAGKEYKKNFEKTHGFDPYNTFANGLIPNFARSGGQVIGVGAFSRFLDLKQSINGVPLGFKEFKRPYPQDIEREYLISKYLESVSGPGFKFPKIFKSLKESVGSGGIFKELIKEPTAADFSQQSQLRLLSTDFINKAVKGFELNHGITPDDLHLGNFTLNDKLQKELSGLASNQNASRILAEEGFLSERTGKVFDFITKQGGAANIIDPGEFRISKERLKELKSRFGAMGIIPNYASSNPLFKGIHGESNLFKNRSNITDYALSPYDFIQKSLSTDSFQAYQNFMLGKLDKKPTLFIPERLQDGDSGKLSGARGAYNDGNIFLSFEKLAGKIKDFGVKGVSSYEGVPEDVLQEIKEISAKKTARTLIHEYAHFTDDTLGVTNRIPQSIFNATKKQLGGYTLNQKTGISVANPGVLTPIGPKNELVDLNNVESVAEAISNSFMEPKRKFLMKNGIFGATKEIKLEDIDLIKYLKDAGLIPAANGVIPNYSPLVQALSRESKAGVPSSNIRVGVSGILKSAANPAGLGVYNTMDEPLGLSQGINRALSQGLNPKTYGAANGIIPNYASPDFLSDPNTFKPFTSEAKRQEFEVAFDGLKTQIKNNTLLFKDISIKVKEFSGTFNLTTDGAKKLQTSLERSSNFYQRSSGVLQGESRSKLLINEGYNTSFLREQFSFRNKNINKLGGSQVINDLISSFSNNIIEGKSSGNSKDVSEFKKLLKENTKALGGTSKDYTEISRIVSDIVPLSAKLKGEYQKQVRAQEQVSAKAKIEQDILNEKIAAAGSLKSLFFGETKKKAQLLKAEDRERFDAARQGLNSRLSSISIAAGFASPILAGVSSQLFSNENPTQRTLGQATQSLGNAASYAGIGAAFGLPGVAVGATIGVLSEAPKIINAFTDNLPDLIKNLESATSKSLEMSDSLKSYIDLENKLQDARKNAPSSVSSIESKQREALESLNPKQKQELSEASKGSTENFVKTFTKLIKDQEKIVESLKFATVFGKDYNFFQNATGIGSAANLFKPRDENDKNKESFFLRPSELAIQKSGRAFYDQGPTDFVFTKDGVNRAKEFSKFILSADSTQKDKFGSPVPIRDLDKNSLLSLGKNIKLIIENDSVANPANERLKELFNRTLGNTEGNEKIREALENFSEDQSNNFIGLSEFFGRQNLSKESLDTNDQLRKRRDQRLSEESKIISDFTFSLFKTVEAVNNFSIALDSVNQDILASLDFTKKSNDQKFDSFFKIQENFNGPKTLTDLKFSDQFRQIENDKNIKVTQANQSFAENFNKIISDKTLSLLKTKLDQALGSKDSDIQGDGRLLSNAVFDFVSPVLQQNQEIQSLLSESNFSAAAEKIQELEAYLRSQSQLLNPLIRPEGASETTSESKKFLESIISELNSAGIQRSLQLGSIDNRASEAKNLAERERQSQLNLINIQKQLSFAGGAENIFKNSQNFRETILGGTDLTRAGESIGDSRLSGLGRFQTAQALQTLGVDVQQTDLFKPLLNDLTETIRRNFNFVGVGVSPEQVAETQLKNTFKTEKDSEELIKQSKNLYSSLESNSLSLKDLVNKMSSEQGFNVTVKNIKDLVDASTGKASNGGYSAAGKDPVAFWTSLRNNSLDPSLRDPFYVPPSKFNTPLSKSVGINNLADDRNNNVNKGQQVQLISGRLPTESNIGNSPKSNQASLSRRISKNSFAESLRSDSAANRNGFGEEFFRNNVINQSITDTSDSSLSYANAISASENAREQALNRIATLSKSEEDNLKAQKRLKQEIDALNQSSLLKGLSALELSKKQITVYEKQVTLQAKLAFSEGRISGQELNAQLRADSESKIKSGDFKVSDAGKLFASELTSYNTQDLYRDIAAGAVETAKTIKGEFSNAFKSFADGTKDADDAFRDFGNSILKKLQDMSIDISTNLLFSAIGDLTKAATGSTGSSDIGNSIASYLSRNSGGPIVKKYSSGGQVKGGSGVRDDVPAMLTEGEYVIKKSAVQSIGVDVLEDINKNAPVYGAGANKPKKSKGNLDFGAAQITKEQNRGSGSFSVVLNNAFAYNDAKRPTGGYFNVSSQLSSLGQTDEDNPNNRLKFQREQDLIGYLEDRKDYDKNKRRTLRNFNRQREQSLKAAYISAAIQLGSYGVSQYNKSGSQNPSDASTFSQYSYDPQNEVSTPYGMRRYQYAEGGRVFGGDSSTDKIPAMLTGGEFVIKKQAVDKYGKSFFDNLNSGRSKKYVEGGYVSPSQDSGNGYLQEMSNVIKELSNAVKSISKVDKAATPDSARERASEPTQSLVNNVSITVNVQKDGGVSSSKKDSSSDNSSKDQEDSKKLADLIKQSVVKVIIEQKRNGGLLAENN